MHLPARRLRLTRVTAATAAALALAVGLTACGSDDSGSDAAATSTVAGSSAVATGAATDDHDHDHGESGDTPTAQSLQAGLEQIANPDVSVDEKVDLVVDGEKRRSHFEQLNAALQTYRGITFQVADIQVNGETATGQTTITSPMGQSAPPMELIWQHQDGTWKLSDSGACVLLGFAQIPCAPA
ncbi:nuclear transport factor 2 family protein [Nocardia sp. X0981]